MTENQKDALAIFIILIGVSILMALSHHQGYKHAQKDQKNQMIERVIHQMEKQEKQNENRT